MTENLFEEKNDRVTFGTSNVSFEDCPNGCVDGYYIDPYTHTRNRCLYCMSKRRSMVKDSLKLEEDGRDIRSILNLPTSFAGDVFNVDSVLPKFAQKDMKQDTIAPVLNLLTELYNDVSIGEPSDVSVLFNLGKRAFESNFIYPYLLRAYQSGLSVSPFLTNYDVSKLFEGSPCTIPDLVLNDVLKADVCVVTILSGALKQSILSVKGLMEFRSHFDRSTIIFTNTWGRHVRDMCTEDGVLSKSLAYLSSIEYDEPVDQPEKEVKSAAPNMSLGMTSEQFNRMLRS